MVSSEKCCSRYFRLTVVAVGEPSTLFTVTSSNRSHAARYPDQRVCLSDSVYPGPRNSSTSLVYKLPSSLQELKLSSTAAATLGATDLLRRRIASQRDVSPSDINISSIRNSLPHTSKASNSKGQNSTAEPRLSSISCSHTAHS